MEVMAFTFATIAIGIASSALARIAALEKKLKETGILDKKIKPD